MNKSPKDWLPPELVRHVTSGCRRPGQDWLAEPPSIISKLEHLWEVSVQEPFSGIEFNFVAAARRKNGEAVVIKIAPPWEPVEIFCEAAYLRRRVGEGCVKLLAAEHASRAHFDKETGKSIPTPHVQTGKINRGPNGKTNLSDKKTRPATKGDIRTARQIVERR